MHNDFVVHVKNTSNLFGVIIKQDRNNYLNNQQPLITKLLSTVFLRVAVTLYSVLFTFWMEVC